MTALVVIASIATILTFVINLFKWLKIQPNDLKRFIAVRGKTIAWGVYLAVALTISAFFIIALSIVVSHVTFSTVVFLFIILIIWGIIGIWAPAIQRLANSKINTILQYTNFVFLLTLVIFCWIFQWPKIFLSIFVTILLVAMISVYTIPIIIEKVTLARVLKRMRNR